MSKATSALQALLLSHLTIGENGKVSTNGVVEVEYGDNLVLNISPNEGYGIKHIFINGESITVDNCKYYYLGEYPQTRVTDNNLISIFEDIKGCRFNPRCENCMQKCKEKTPVLTEISPHHTVSCWLY